jgi:hypothetical protein
MKRGAIALALALLLLALLAWRFARVSPADSASSASPRPTAVSAPASATPKGQAVPAERSTLADTLNSPSTDIRADLRLVSDIVDTFRSNFPQSGNPVGTNGEITAALTGKNKLQLALIPRDHPAINRAGELCDRWGTPFFFHAESARKMEIRSAGPDRKLWNDDDVTFVP